MGAVSDVFAISDPFRTILAPLLLHLIILPTLPHTIRRMILAPVLPHLTRHVRRIRTVLLGAVYPSPGSLLDFRFGG